MVKKKTHEKKKTSSDLARVARVHPLHVLLHERDVLVVALPPRVAVESARVAEGVLAAGELFFFVVVERETKEKSEFCF